MQKTKTNPIQTVLTIVVGLVIIHFITDIRWLIILSIILGLIGVFSPFLTKKVDYVWMKLAWVLSLIVPNILLSIIFYLFLFPIALLSRLFNKDNLMLKNDKRSLFRDRESKFDKAYFEKIW